MINIVLNKDLCTKTKIIDIVLNKCLFNKTKIIKGIINSLPEERTSIVLTNIKLKEKMRKDFIYRNIFMYEPKERAILSNAFIRYDWNKIYIVDSIESLTLKYLLEDILCSNKETFIVVKENTDEKARLKVDKVLKSIIPMYEKLQLEFRYISYKEYLKI